MELFPILTTFRGAAIVRRSEKKTKTKTKTNTVRGRKRGGMGGGRAFRNGKDGARVFYEFSRQKETTRYYCTLHVAAKTFWSANSNYVVLVKGTDLLGRR